MIGEYDKSINDLLIYLSANSESLLRAAVRTTRKQAATITRSILRSME